MTFKNSKTESRDSKKNFAANFGPKKSGASQNNSNQNNSKTRNNLRPTFEKLPGLIYHGRFISREKKAEFLQYFQSIYPIFEMRFSKNNPPPEGDTQRPLLRPVYWLGNWQFACLNYYHPPKGVEFRCMKAEVFPPFMQKIVNDMEKITRDYFPKKDIPEGWHLNTCLINFYGNDLRSGKKEDCARVGDHKDFEPGPVASLSFGERAFFQFVFGNSKLKNNVAYERWLDDSSLLIFAGEFYKDKTFHRVQRVEDKKAHQFTLNLEGFDTRRINLTFRYVPDHHIYEARKFPATSIEDVLPYIDELALKSETFQKIALDLRKTYA